MRSLALKRIGECSKCGKCCLGFSLSFDRVLNRDEIKYYKLHNIKVSIVGSKTVLRFNIPCSQLDQNTGLCKIYGKGRPIVCMKYPREEDAKNLQKQCTYKFEKE